jgi:2-methylcitrate dehydratase PrpD
MELNTITVTDQLIDKVLNTKFENLGDKTVENTKNRIIDAIGCTIAGANASGSPNAVGVVKEWGGTKESTILVHGIKAPANNVAMANAILTRSHDFEPCGPYYQGRLLAGHVSGTTVPAALAVAEKVNAGGKDLISALALGDDFTVRLLAASNYHFTQGWDCTGTVNALGATVIAGRLLGLDSHQMKNALGIVVNQLAGVIQIVYDSNHTFKLPQGLAARAGIMSAEMAKHGFLGIKDFLASYFTQYCNATSIEKAVDKLDSEYLSDCVTKPYPCCRVLGGSVDCAVDIVKKNTFNAADIDSVLVNIANIKNTGEQWSSFMGKPFVIGEVPQIQAAFSLVYMIADVLARKSVNLNHFTESALRDPAVLELSNKVKMGDNPELTASQCAGILVKMKNGQTYTAFTDVARGDPLVHPLSKEELLGKFRSNVAFSKTISEKNSEKALELLDNLEKVSSVKNIVKKLVI